MRDVREHPYSGRRTKRELRKQGYTPIVAARDVGEAAAMYESHMPRRWRSVDVFPPHAKARRAAWLDGYNNADPMGEHHGRNQ